jgi:hypothetical protein
MKRKPVVVASVVLTGSSATASVLTLGESGTCRMLCCDWYQYASTHHFMALVGILLVGWDGQRLDLNTSPARKLWRSASCPGAGVKCFLWYWRETVRWCRLQVKTMRNDQVHLYEAVGSQELSLIIPAGRTYTESWYWSRVAHVRVCCAQRMTTTGLRRRFYKARSSVHRRIVQTVANDSDYSFRWASTYVFVVDIVILGETSSYSCGRASAAKISRLRGTKALCAEGAAQEETASGVSEKVMAQASWVS